MSMLEAVRRLVSGLPEGATVTLPREVLVEWLESAQDGPGTSPVPSSGDVADLTVPELAEALQRAESTVRGWLSSVPGAYKLGGEWRVPRAAWRGYLDSLSEPDAPATNEIRSNRRVDLSDWRSRRGVA